MNAFIGDLMKKRQRGVTLIELLTVIVVVAILASIAIPSYRRYVLRAQRTDAKTLILQAQTAEEKFVLQNNTYTADVTGLPSAGGLGLLNVSEHGLYQIGVALRVNNGAPGYVITAAPIAGAGQTDDTDCGGTFTLAEDGTRTATNSGGTDNSAYCWK
jgi:type IV pilus assembly protein PilE